MFLDIVIGILAFIFVLGLIIAIHEGGHFFFARRAGILCREYAFGMGPLLYKKRKGETLYTIRAFPIGGFCAIAGEEVEDDPLKDKNEIKLDIKNGIIKGIYLDVDKEELDFPIYTLVEYDIYDELQTGKLYMKVLKDGEVKIIDVDPQAFIYSGKLEYQIAPYNRTLGSKSKRARAMVMFGGPLMNFLLALVAFLIVGLFNGFPVYESSQIEDVIDGSPAQVAGLQPGDVITKLSSDNYTLEVDEWNDISSFFDEYEIREINSLITVEFLRNNVEYSKTFIPEIVLYNMYIFSDTSTLEVKIGDIITVNDKMADNSQLQTGDIIKKINGRDVNSWNDVIKEAKAFVGGSEDEKKNIITMTVNRDGVDKNITVRPFSKNVIEDTLSPTGDKISVVKVQMGISPTYKFNLIKSFKYSVERTVDSGMAVIDTIGLLINDSTVTFSALSGPVGIYNMTSSIASQGFIQILSWLGLLSVNVGLMNLLPIPALDGGRLVFLGYEAITNKKPNPKVETALITVTMLLLFGLIIFVTFNDVLKIFK